MGEKVNNTSPLPWDEARWGRTLSSKPQLDLTTYEQSRLINSGRRHNAKMYWTYAKHILWIAKRRRDALSDDWFNNHDKQNKEGSWDVDSHHKAESRRWRPSDWHVFLGRDANWPTGCRTVRNGSSEPRGAFNWKKRALRFGIRRLRFMIEAFSHRFALLIPSREMTRCLKVREEREGFNSCFVLDNEIGSSRRSLWPSCLVESLFRTG